MPYVDPQKQREHSRRYYHEHLEHAKAVRKKYRNTHKKELQFLHVYATTRRWFKQHGEQLQWQGGGCAICGALVADKTHKLLALDHDHKTGKTRGLLCTNCNLGLGKFQDDPELLEAAARYLYGHR